MGLSPRKPCWPSWWQGFALHSYVVWRLFLSLPLNERLKLIAYAIRKVVPMDMINRIRKVLRGKKAYLAAAAGLLGALIAWADEQITGVGFLAALWAAVQACFIRAGISNEVAKTQEE